VQKKRYVDHDRSAEADSDETDYSRLLAWPGFAKSRQQASDAASKKSSVPSPVNDDECSEQPVRSVRSKLNDNSAGLYDSPATDSSSAAVPEGSYDSPRSDVEKEEALASMDKVRTRFAAWLTFSHRQVFL